MAYAVSVTLTRQTSFCVTTNSWLHYFLAKERSILESKLEVAFHEIGTKIFPKLSSKNLNSFLYVIRQYFFFNLFTILNSRHSSQPITIVYFSSWPIASLGERKKIKKYGSKVSKITMIQNSFCSKMCTTACTMYEIDT